MAAGQFDNEIPSYPNHGIVMNNNHTIDNTYPFNALPQNGTSSIIDGNAFGVGGVVGTLTGDSILIGSGGGGCGGLDVGTPYNGLRLEDLNQKILEQYFGKMKSVNWFTDVTDPLCLKARLELPGVLPQAMGVVFSEGKLKIVGQKFHTQEKFNIEYDLPSQYDPETIEATLQHGIFSFTVKTNPKWSEVKNIKLKKS